MIPSTVKTLVSAAHAAAKAHLELKRVYADEASSRVKLSKQKALFDSMEKLVETLRSLETELASMKKSAGTDWSGILRSITGFVDIVAKARAGTLDGKAVKSWIDAEVIDVQTSRPAS